MPPAPPTEAAADRCPRTATKVSFIHQKVVQRAAIVAAGPLANFVLAIVIFAVIFMVYGKQTESPRVDTVQPDSAAAAAGFQPGDLVLSIDGGKIETSADMQRIVSMSAGEKLTIVVERGGETVTLHATPKLRRDEGPVRQQASHRRARHQPLDGPRRASRPEQIGPATGRRSPARRRPGT